MTPGGRSEVAFRERAGFDSVFVGVTVEAGAADFWGGVRALAAEDAARVVAGNVRGVVAVRDRLTAFLQDVRNAVRAA